MSQSFDIEDYINSTSADINQFITDQGSQNSFTARLFDITLSAQEKMEIMDSNMLQKQYELSGYRKGRLFLIDADSGEIEDPITGIRTKVRLSDFNMYDAVDDPSTLKDKNKKSSLSAQLQARQVADLTGKNEWELLDEDYQNVKKYQYQQVLGQFQDKDYKFTPYERDTQYQEMRSVPLNVLYRPTGKIDKNERVLVEAVNPISNRQVTFDIGNNPYLNSRFSTVRSINSDANIRKLEAYQMNEDARKASISALQEIWDVDSDTLLGRVEDDIDLFQSFAYRSAARVLQYGPDFLVDSKKWKDIANAETGQVLADAWAGVSTATRRKFASKMIEASDAWDRGDWVDAILGWGSQLDRVLAESATLMALVAGGTLATGGILGGTALAGTTAARLGSMFIGASVGATDVTLSMTEDYKLNNGGKNPSLSEVASMWAINTALLMPEALMAGINIGKVLPKSVSNRLNIAYQMKALPSRAKIVGMSMLEETIQEAFQESFETYGSQKGGMFNGEREFWSDILRNEGVKAGIVGGMAGGALSGVVQTTTAPFAYRKEVRITEARKKAQKDFEETTNIGTKADATISKSTIDSIQALPPTIDSINQIDKALEIPNLSQQAQQTLFKRKNDIIFELASKGQLDEATKRSYGSDPNAIFKERVLLTDPEGELDFNGTRTPKSIKQQYDKLKQEGKQLGLSDEVITKTIEEVKYDVRDGFRGYNTYLKSIKDLQEQIDEGISNNTDVDALVKQRTHTTNRLKHLYQNQVAKLNSLVNAAVDISQGRGRTVPVSFINSYNTERPFKVRGLNLFIDRIKSGTGVYGVIDDVKLEIAEMNEAMTELGITSTSDMSKIDTLSDTFAKAVSDIKQKYDYNYFANPEEASTELSDKELSKIKKAVEAPSDKKLMEVRKEFSTNQLEQAIDKLGKDSKETTILQNIIKDRVETQKILTENETEVSDIKKTATDNKSKFSEERLNKITDINKLRRFYKAMLTSTLTELRRVYGRNSSDTELKDLVDYYNTFADKVIEKGNILKLASITQQAEETTNTKEVSPTKETTNTKEETEEATTKEETKKETKLQRTIADIVIDYYVVPREDLDNVPGRFTGDRILLANQISKDDLNIIKQFKDRLADYGIDYDSIISKLKESDVRDFILLHEFRHMQQSNKRNSYQEYKKEYDNNPGRFEIDALLYPLGKLGLISPKQYNDAQSKFIEDTKQTDSKINIQDNNITLEEQSNTSTIDSDVQSNIEDNYVPDDNIPYDADYQAYMDAVINSDTYADVSSTEPIDSTSEPVDSTPSSSASKTVARKVFSTFDTFIKKLPKLRSLLSTSNFDKETELTELLNQHESAIEEYNRLMTVERKTWEDQLLTQKAKSFKNKNYLEERIDQHKDTVSDFNKRIRAAQRRLKKLKENGFTDEANTVQIQQLEQTINNLKTNKVYKNAIKQIKSLNTRMDKYFLTEKEIADRIKELDKFYGKNILPLERKIQDILTKSDNSVSKELLSSTFEILEDGRNILHNSINFNDEVTVSNFAESVLGNDLVNIKDSTIKAIVEKFQSFAPKFGTRKGLVKYLNRTSRNDKGIETSYLFNAPHTQLLYQLDGKTLTVNPNVAVAIHLGLHQYFTHIDIYREFQPTKMEELGKIFGNMNAEPSSRLGDEDAFITSAFISAFGIPRSTVVNAIGDTILRNLGIVAKDTGTVGFYEKLSAAFGEQALVYAEQLGYITNTQIPSKAEAKYVLPDGTSATKNEDGLYPSDAVINPLNNRTNMIKFNFDLVEVVTEVATEVEALTLDNIYSKKPQPFPSKLPENMTARNTKDISPVAKLLQEKVLSKLFNTRYKINYELVDLVLQNRAAVENYLGLVPKDAIEKNYIKDVKEGLIGVSRTITQQLDDLAEVYNWGSPYLFFKWYMSKNGRFFMDSIHVNMQQFKALQRFFVLPENSHKIFELGYDKNGNVVESQQMKEFYYAIAQAFDSLGKHEDVEAFAKRILAVPAEELKQALFPTDGKSQTLFGKGSKYGIKKLENFGQALLTIQAIGDYQKAIEAKKPRFKTWVSVENDSTTSAFFIGMLQHPYKALIDSLGPKVGVVDSNNSSIPFSSDLTISHMKKMEVTSTKDGKTVKEKFLDIYQTIASRLILIPVGKKGQKYSLHNNLWKAYFASNKGEYVAPEYFSLISYGIENVKTLYSSLLPALPEAALDGAVSTALRTLIKSPTMTYIYGQGRASLMKELGQELTTSLLTQFCDAVVVDESTLTEEEKAQRNAVLAVFDSLAKRIYNDKQLGVDRETLRNMLIKQYSTQIRLRLENRNGLTSMDSLEGERVYPTLHEYLSNTLAATYGSSVMEALDVSFGAMLEINQSKNIMFNTMFDCFEQELNYELEKKRIEREAAGERFTRADEQDVIKSLFDIMPAIKTLYDSATEQSVLLMDTEKMTDSRYAVNAPFFKGHNKDTGYIDNDARYSYANVRKFINSGRAGAVLPIHFLDGTAMAMMLEKYGKEILPLHDAIQVNAIGSTEATQYFNKINYLINKDYDLYSTLVDRFREVLDNTQKRREARGMNSDINKDTIGNTTDPIWKQFFGISEKLIDDFGNVTKTNRPPTIQEFYTHVLMLQAINTNNRNDFYHGLGSNQRMIANIDGPVGSGWIVTDESIKSNAFMQGIMDEQNAEDIKRAFGSDPSTFTTKELLNELNYGALTDANVRVRILHELNKMDGNRESKEHMAYLEDLVKKIDLKALADSILNDKLKVQVYRSDTDSNKGRLENDIIKVALDGSTRSIPLTGQSGATIYTHELIHAAFEYIINNSQTLGVNREIQELLNLQKQAMDAVTWEAFVPVDYETSPHKELYIKKAKEVWDYIFNNSSDAKFSSLHEFLSYAMTNPVLREKLSDVYVDNKKNNLDKLRLLDRVIALGSALLDVFRGRGQIKDVARATANLFGSNIDIDSKVKLLDRLDTLMENIAHANNRSIKKLEGHPIRAIESVFNTFADLISRGNKALAPKAAYIANIADETGYSKKWNVRLDDSFLDGVKAVSNVLGLLLVSRSRRQSLMPMLNSLVGLNQQGAIATIWREFQEPDEMTSDLELLSGFTKMTEQASKALEEQVRYDLKEAFGRDLKEHETHSLTQALLYTDLSSLLTFKDEQITNIDYVMDLLKNPEHINEEIKNIHNILYSQIKHDGQFNWYINSAKSLANQMVTNVGHEGTVLNARAIAEGSMTGKSYETTDAIVDLIDRLTTLYALSETNVSDLNVVSKLNTKGIENMLRTQYTFKKETLESQVIDKIHTMKGYTKLIMDEAIDIRYGRIEDKTDFESLGYTLVKKLPENSYIEQVGMAIYKRNNLSPKRRDGATFIITGQQAQGTSLMDSTFMMMDELKITSKEKIYSLHDEYLKKAEALSRSITSNMHSRIMSMDEIKNLGKGYTPILSPNGGASDFRINMSRTNQRSILKIEENAIDILSKMYAQKNMKVEASEKNKIVVNFLKNDMEKNKTEFSNFSPDGKNFVRLQKDSDNKFIREAWQSLPKELKDEIKKADKKDGFWVRDEWLIQLFGAPTISINDAKVVKDYTTNNMKYFIGISEVVAKLVGYLAKQNIVIRFPAVLIGNIISNFNMSYSLGFSPARVFKKTVENAKNVREYMDNKKALERIKYKQRIGTVTEAELKRVNWYQTKLESNPVHPLMEKGFYQSIVEDISMDDIESIGKISKPLSRKLKKHPRVKKVLQTLFLLEGNPYFDFMFQATQYSDFIARATHYQLMVERATALKTRTGKPNPYYIQQYKLDSNGKDAIDSKGRKIVTPEFAKFEKQLTIDIWNMFINYDKPQSSIEQYANDMGLIMFTKFLKRIQFIIAKGFIQSPVSSLLFLLSQSVICESPNIYDYVLPTRNIMWNVFNPLSDNLVNATIPIPIQYMTDTGLFGRN